MIFNGTEEQEKEYLQQVIDIINDTINSTDKSVKEHVDTLQEYKDYLWSNKDIDPHEIRSMRESILNHFARGENVIDKRNRLSMIVMELKLQKKEIRLIQDMPFWKDISAMIR